MKEEKEEGAGCFYAVMALIAVLAFGLYHGINGLRGIVLESTASASTGHIVTWVLIVFGIIVFIWGTYVPVALSAS